MNPMPTTVTGTEALMNPTQPTMTPTVITATQAHAATVLPCPTAAVWSRMI